MGLPSCWADAGGGGNSGAWCLAPRALRVRETALAADICWTAATRERVIEVTPCPRWGDGALASRPVTGPSYVHEGDLVRALVSGSKTHSVLGTVVSVHPSHVVIHVIDRGRDVKFPRGSIISIEVETYALGKPQWTPGAIPPALDDLLRPFETLFLTGSGALPRAIAKDQLTAADELCDRVDSALIEHAKRDAVSKLRQAIAEYAKLGDADFDRAQRARQSANEIVASILEESGRDMAPVCRAADTLRRHVEQTWRENSSKFDPKPRFLSDKSAPRASVAGNGETELALRIRLESNGAPATSITLHFDESEEIAHLAEAPVIARMVAGETRTIRLPVVLNHSLASRSFSLRLRTQMTYLVPSGEKKTSPKQTLEFHVIPESQFEQVPNPYAAYAGGSKVADPQMFFGRAGMIADLVRQLREGPLGVGYAIYGQKRSGKSSLIEQVRLQCDSAPVIACSVSFGLLDRSNLTASFAKAVLDEMKFAILERVSPSSFANLSALWPSDDRIDQRPIGSFQSALIAGRKVLAKEPGWNGVRYVFLFDEFTYLFEVLRSSDYSAAAREDVREFMRQWKALLETRVFSSVIVGQDTMPQFMKSFPNEFSSMTPVRLAYLTDEETKNLADRPIADQGGRSRYTGYALESIYGYTSGHPFFTQVLCDRLVQTVNSSRRSQITDTDVDDAFESLVDGVNRIDPFRFDCLLTADNTGLVSMREDGEVVEEKHDPDADYPYSVLARLAALSGPSNKYVDVAEVVSHDDDMRVIEDLSVRQVIEGAESIRVKMPLFAEYLRRNS